MSINSDVPESVIPELVSEYIQKSANYLKQKSIEKKRELEQSQRELLSAARQEMYERRASQDRENAQNMMAVFEKTLIEQNQQLQSMNSLDEDKLDEFKDNLENSINDSHLSTAHEPEIKSIKNSVNEKYNDMVSPVINDPDKTIDDYNQALNTFKLSLSPEEEEHYKQEFIETDLEETIGRWYFNENKAEIKTEQNLDEPSLEYSVKDKFNRSVALIINGPDYSKEDYDRVLAEYKSSLTGVESEYFLEEIQNPGLEAIFERGFDVNHSIDEKAELLSLDSALENSITSKIENKFKNSSDKDLFTTAKEIKSSFSKMEMDYVINTYKKKAHEMSPQLNFNSGRKINI